MRFNKFVPVVSFIFLFFTVSLVSFSQGIVSTSSCDCFSETEDRLFADDGNFVYWQSGEQLRRGTVNVDSLAVDTEVNYNGFNSADRLFAADGNVVYWQSGNQVRRGSISNGALTVDSAFWFDGLNANSDRLFDAEGDLLYWQFGGVVVRGTINNGNLNLDNSFRFEGFSESEDRLFAADGDYVYWQAGNTIRRGIVGQGTLTIDQEFLINSFRGTAFDAKDTRVSWTFGSTFHRGGESFENPSPVVDDPSDNIHATYADVVNGNVRGSNDNLLTGKYDVILDGVIDLPSGFLLKGVELNNGSVSSIDGHTGLTFAGMPLIAGKTANVSNNKIGIEGGIKLPVVPLPSGAFIFGVQDNRFMIEEGTVRVPKVSIPKLFGMEGNLTIGQGFFDLNGRFGMRGLGGDPVKVGWMGGGATIRNNFIDRLALEGSSLNIPLGQTQAYLDHVDVEVSSITDPKNITLKGGVIILGGPKVAGLSAVTVEVNGSITPFQGIFSLKGESYLFTFIKMSEQSVSVNLPEKELHLYNKVVYPWFTGTGELHFTGPREVRLPFVPAPFNVIQEPARFYGSGEVSLELKVKIPVLGEKTLRAAGVNLAISESYIEGTLLGPSVPVPVWDIPPIQIKQSYASMRLTFGNELPTVSVGLKKHYETWETSHNPVYIIDPLTSELIPVDMSAEGNQQSSVQLSSTEEPVLYASFLNNWILLDKVYLADPSSISTKSVRISQDTSSTITVPENINDAIVRISFENSGVDEVIAQLISPDGESYDQIIFEPQSQEAFFWLVTPEPGEYTVEVVNREALGNVAVELIQIDQPPVIESFNVSPTGNANEYLVAWEDFDLESDADIRFSLAPDRDGVDGFYFAQVTEDEETNSFVFNTQDESLDVPSGDYYVIMEIDDGVNTPEHTVSNQRVQIINPNDPLPVYGIAVDAQDQQFAIRWNKPEDERIAGYTILYTPLDDLGHFDDHVAVTDPDITNFIVEGVENGVPLLVTVVAVDEDGNRSYAAEVVRVIPHEPNGTTSPDVISVPNQDAEVGSLYVYSPQFANSERFAIAEYSLSSTLVSGPVGMEVDLDGDIVWMPTVDQLGEHEVVIHHNFFFPSTGETEQEVEQFVVDVIDADSLFGEETETEILSQPDISAFEKTLYSYQIVANDPDGLPVYVLNEGPEGMTVDDDGLVQWNVPDFTSAYFPVRISVFFTNGEIEEQDFILDVVTAENSFHSSNLIDDVWTEFE